MAAGDEDDDQHSIESMASIEGQQHESESDGEGETEESASDVNADEIVRSKRSSTPSGRKVHDAGVQGNLGGRLVKKSSKKRSG